MDQENKGNTKGVNKGVFMSPLVHIEKGFPCLKRKLGSKYILIPIDPSIPVNNKYVDVYLEYQTIYEEERGKLVWLDNATESDCNIETKRGNRFKRRYVSYEELILED